MSGLIVFDHPAGAGGSGRNALGRSGPNGFTALRRVLVPLLVGPVIGLLTALTDRVPG